MTTAFKVGVFAIFTVIAIFAVWILLGNFSLRRNSYSIAVHFRNVVGLQNGAPVQVAGVDVGVVDDIKLLPDQTASVFCTIHGDNTIYRGSIFTVATTLTGQSTLTIFPPEHIASAVPLPRHPLPEAEQPEGLVPPTIADLVNEGEKRMRDLDKTLAIVNAELPGVIQRFNGVAEHTDTLILHADTNFNQLGTQLNTTVASINGLVGSLNGMLAVNGRNISEMTTSMRQLVVGNGPRLAKLIDNLSATADNLNKTMAAVSSIATDPNMKSNLMTATTNLKESSEKLKAIANDIQSITGDPQVQSELKGAVQNLSEAIAKANALLGVSTAQAPAPGQPTGGPASGQGSAPGSAPGAGTSPAPHSAPAYHIGGAKNTNPFELATADVRLNWNKLPSGPISDLNVNVLPTLQTHLTFGANSLGTNTTYNFLVDMRGSPNLEYSFGVLYSNLGLRTVWHGLGPFGIDARLYNSQYPQLDLYGDVKLARRLQLFYGQKSLVGPAANRQPQFGVQFGY
jgi:phospholipid/cholesterol/gamma-HCH transport system substrate-binding protein